MVVAESGGGSSGNTDIGDLGGSVRLLVVVAGGDDGEDDGCGNDN